MVHVGAGLDVQPPGHPPVRRQRGHDAVAQALAADAVDDPVGILLEVVARGYPVLHAEFAVGVVDLEILPVRGDVHTARKTVQPHQRVHVETARHGFVVHRLTHEIDVSVEFHPLAQNIRRGTQVEIVAYHPVFPGDAPLGGIGIGEIALNQLRTRGHGQTVHRRHPRPEELPDVVVRRHAAACAPAFDPAAHPVAVLKLGQAERPLKSQVRGERHLLFLGAAALGRNQDDAVGSLAAVQRGRRGSLKNRHALDVLGIEVRDAVAAVAVAGVGDASDGRIGLFGRGVQHRHTVDHIQRLVVAGHRTDAADTHFGRSARPRGARIDLHAGRLARQRKNHIRGFDGRQLPALDLVGGIGQVGIVAFEAEGRHDNLCNGLHILLQHDLQFGARARFDGAGSVADIGEIERSAGRDLNREPAVGERRRSVRSTPLHDGDSDQRGARFIGNTASDLRFTDIGRSGNSRSGSQA